MHWNEIRRVRCIQPQAYSNKELDTRGLIATRKQKQNRRKIERLWLVCSKLYQVSCSLASVETQKYLYQPLYRYLVIPMGSWFGCCYLFFTQGGGEKTPLKSAKLMISSQKARSRHWHWEYGLRPDCRRATHGPEIVKLFTLHYHPAKISRFV